MKLEKFAFLFMNDVTNIQKVIVSSKSNDSKIPLGTTGFSSPADDYVESGLDIAQKLIRHPLTTYFMEMDNDLMQDAGILPNASLIVDRMIETKSGDIVAVRVGDETWVRQLLIDGDGKLWLMPRNINHKPFEVTEDLDFEVWGKVIWSINKH